MTSWRPGQAPHDVAATCARVASAWSKLPLTTVIARHEMSKYGPCVRDPTGAWFPRALWRWARALTFFREPADTAGEVIQTLPVTIAVGGGDCDDLATGQATLARCVGLLCWVVLVTTGPSCAHVFCAVGQDWTQRPGHCWSVDPELPDGPVPLGLMSASRARRPGGFNVPGARFFKVA